MKIHSNLFTFNGFYDIEIQGIDCTYKNINIIMKVFTLNQVLITIDSLDRKSNLLQLLDSLQLKYISTSINCNIDEISVIVPSRSIETVLKVVIENDPENVFLTNLTELIDLQNLLLFDPLNILQNGFSDVTATVARDKQTVHLSVSKRHYCRKKVLKQLRDFLINSD